MKNVGLKLSRENAKNRRASLNKRMIKESVLEAF